MTTSLPDRSNALLQPSPTGLGESLPLGAQTQAADAQRLMALTPQLRALAHIRRSLTPRSL